MFDTLEKLASSMTGVMDSNKKSYNCDLLTEKARNLYTQYKDAIEESVEKHEDVGMLTKVNPDSKDCVILEEISIHLSTAGTKLCPVLLSSGRGLFRGITKDNAPEFYNMVCCLDKKDNLVSSISKTGLKVLKVGKVISLEE